MSLSQIAVILLGVFLIVTSQTPVSATVTLILGIAVIALVALDGRRLPGS